MVATSDNTSGTGINSVCQATRFADPRGRARWYVASPTSTPGTRRTMVQTVEICRSTAAPAQRYKTTLGWFAGCRRRGCSC